MDNVAMNKWLKSLSGTPEPLKCPPIDIAERKRLIAEIRERNAHPLKYFLKEAPVYLPAHLSHLFEWLKDQPAHLRGRWSAMVFFAAGAVMIWGYALGWWLR